MIDSPLRREEGGRQDVSGANVVKLLVMLTRTSAG